MHRQETNQEAEALKKMKVECSSERQLLSGNLNRMSVTDSEEELDMMYDIARKRLDRIYFLYLQAFYLEKK